MTSLARSFRRTGSDRPQALARIAGGLRSVGNMAETKLQLQYRVRPEAEPSFSYRTWTHSAAPMANAFEQFLDALAWGEMVVRYLVGSLDIAVSIHDTIIEVETFNNDLSWSLKKDAVVVDGGHTHLYYDLLYWDGFQWVKREDFTQSSCRLIRITAKHNKAGKLGDRYKFTYNVVFTPRSGGSSEHPIDPDIQNPKV